MLKRLFSLLLLLALLVPLAACEKKEADLGGALSQGLQSAGSQASPVETPPTEEPAQPEEYQTFLYKAGGITIGVPFTISPQPEFLEEGIRYADPEGEWTLEFVPLSKRWAPMEENNLRTEMERFAEMDYYSDVVAEDSSFGPYYAFFCSFRRNPDWDGRTMADTLSYREPHAFWVVNYGNDVIAGNGGLRINVNTPEGSNGDIAALLQDPELRTLLDHVSFGEVQAAVGLEAPGIVANVPARWDGRVDSSGIMILSIQGDRTGNLYLQPSIYADPVQAAGTVSKEYRTLSYGGRDWYGGIRVNALGEKPVYTLDLYTAFSPYHALELKLTLQDGEPEDTWDYAREDPIFTEFMNTLVLDPAGYHDPELDMKDDDGFECNSAGEISAYTGAAAQVTVPAVIGSTDITGIKDRVFKDNTTVTKVTVSEGITYISNHAFQDCTSLTTVILPDSLTYIDRGAFTGCTALTTVVFGSGLKEIDNWAFEDCASLGDVILGTGVARIGDGAFLYAGSGEGRFFCAADSVAYGHSALYETRFQTVEFGPNADLSQHSILASAHVGAVTIGEGCAALGDDFLESDVYTDEEGMWHYYNEPLEVTLPESLKTIGEKAFQGRLGLKRIDLHGVEAIGDSCFAFTGLVDILVPGTVKEVPDSAFSNCPDVMTITLEEGVETVREFAFSQAGAKDTMPMGYYCWLLSPESVERNADKLIANGADPLFTTFVTLRLPSTLKEVESCAFCAIFLQGVYLEWCQSPQELPSFAEDAFASCGLIGQFYFSKEAIDAYGTELDAAISQLEEVGECAWYDEGGRMYWSAYGQLDLG